MCSETLVRSRVKLAKGGALTSCWQSTTVAASRYPRSEIFSRTPGLPGIPLVLVVSNTISAEDWPPN